MLALGALLAAVTPRTAGSAATGEEVLDEEALQALLDAATEHHADGLVVLLFDLEDLHDVRVHRFRPIGAGSHLVGPLLA